MCPYWYRTYGNGFTKYKPTVPLPLTPRLEFLEYHWKNSGDRVIRWVVVTETLGLTTSRLYISPLPTKELGLHLRRDRRSSKVVCSFVVGSPRCRRSPTVLLQVPHGFTIGFLFPGKRSTVTTLWTIFTSATDHFNKGPTRSSVHHGSPLGPRPLTPSSLSNRSHLLHSRPASVSALDKGGNIAPWRLWWSNSPCFTSACEVSALLYLRTHQTTPGV